MRITKMRYDIYICLVIAGLAGWGTGKILDKTVKRQYDTYAENHVAEEGDTGGIAGDDVFRAESINDLLSHDTFTITSPGIDYKNEGMGFYGSYTFYNVALPSGERVAAAINMQNVQSDDEISTLPVGTLVYEELSENESFLSQIGTVYPLTRTDFYVDMSGKSHSYNKTDYTEMKKFPFQAAAFLISFSLFHMLGAKVGIFPYFFAPKKKKESEWK